MVYIRNKKVKGIDYAYQVQSMWDPVVIGGSAFDNRNHHLNSTSSVFLMNEASFDDIMKLVKASIK